MTPLDGTPPTPTTVNGTVPPAAIVPLVTPNPERVSMIRFVGSATNVLAAPRPAVTVYAPYRHWAEAWPFAQNGVEPVATPRSYLPGVTFSVLSEYVAEVPSVLTELGVEIE